MWVLGPEGWSCMARLPCSRVPASVTPCPLSPRPGLASVPPAPGPCSLVHSGSPRPTGRGTVVTHCGSPVMARGSGPVPAREAPGKRGAVPSTQRRRLSCLSPSAEAPSEGRPLDGSPRQPEDPEDLEGPGHPKESPCASPEGGSAGTKQQRGAPGNPNTPGTGCQ